MGKKTELLTEAKKLKLEVSEKNTIKEIETALKSAQKTEVVKQAEEVAVEQTTEKIAELVETEAIAEAIVEVEHEIDAEEKSLAKAGKRSAKAIKEAEEKQEKEVRKAAVKEGEATEKPKIQQKPARTRLERRGKGYRKVSEQVDKNKAYDLKEAVNLALKTSTTKFDSTVELHMRLGVDPKHADQNIRDMVTLPAGTGKTVRVAVFADVDDVAAAKKAGADVAGSDDFLAQLDKGVINFDVLISSPKMMAKLGKYARVLGPKGLMPNPKSGTVTNDIDKAIKEAKAGRVEYRVDSTGIVHVGIGKVSFGPEKIMTNVETVIASIKAARPSGLKGSYVKSIYLTTSMGPSILVDNSAAN